MEQLESAETEYAESEAACQDWVERRQQSEEFWNDFLVGKTSPERESEKQEAETERLKQERETKVWEEEYDKLCSLRDSAWETWNTLCLEWSDEWLEIFLSESL